MSDGRLTNEQIEQERIVIKNGLVGDPLRAVHVDALCDQAKLVNAPDSLPDEQAFLPNLSQLVGNLLQSFYFLLEDSEEIADCTYKFESDGMDKVAASVEALESALPDEPGYICNYPHKARYAIDALRAHMGRKG